VAEHLHEVVGARTLFATHYYELARAAQDWPQARNLHVRAEEHDGAVVFLYRVAPGVADKSFALHVARMAGMPEPITLRAADLLAAASSGEGQGAARESGEQEDEGTAREVAEPPAALEYLPVARHEHARGSGGASERHLAEVPGAAADDGDDRAQGKGELARELLAIDLASTTPIEALNRLLALQQWARTLVDKGGHTATNQRHGHRA
jgi:DNA mismatch repair ATPase MutS